MGKALELAEELEKMAAKRMPLTGHGVIIGLSYSAAELRRLHAENEALRADAGRLLLAAKVRDALHLANYLMNPTATENDAAAYIEARNSVLKSLEQAK